MKVSREDVKRNKTRILASAGRLFRERGFDGVNVAEIMGDADLTHGAFYGYFKSKGDLIDQTLAALTPSLRDSDVGSPKGAASTNFVKAYLNQTHRDDVGDGCPFAALGSELVRAPKTTRKLLTRAVRARIENLTKTADGPTERERRRAAIGSWSAMVGALMLSRLVDDPEFSDELLDQTRAWLKD